MKITVKVVFACTCAWRLFPLPVGLRLQTALTVILLGFNNGRAGRMAPFACARPGLRCPAWCGGCPGTTQRGRRRGYCTKASGRSWCGEFPGGRLASAFSWTASFPPCRVRGHAPPGARRAPRALENVEKVLTDREDAREDARVCCPA